MVSPTKPTSSAYPNDRLEEFGALLAALGDAILRNDETDTLTHIYAIAKCDPDTAHAMADYLIFAGLIEEG